MKPIHMSVGLIMQVHEHSRKHDSNAITTSQNLRVLVYSILLKNVC